MDADVIVVGAGPAGSATALLLARLGHRVMVLDRARFPRAKPCGEYLNPTAVATLDRLRVLERIRPMGRALSGMYIAGPDGASVWAPFARGHGLLIRREHLDHALLQAAATAGATVLEGARVDAVSRGAVPMVRGRRGGPLDLRARVVVGADGMRSVVARRGGRLQPPAGGHYTIGARFDSLAVRTPRGDLYLGYGWYAGAALFGDGIGNVVVAVPRDAFRQVAGGPALIFDTACRALPALHRLTREARRLSPFVSVGPLGFARRPSVDDGVILVGDAASTINPMTGEGIAMALRGAEMAAATIDRALRSDATSGRALATYERARTEAFADTWRVSRLLQWIVRHPRLAAHLSRRLAADPPLAGRLLGVVNEGRPATDILSPGFLLRLMAGRA